MIIIYFFKIDWKLILIFLFADEIFNENYNGNWQDTRKWMDTLHKGTRQPSATLHRRILHRVTLHRHRVRDIHMPHSRTNGLHPGERKAVFSKDGKYG